MGSTISNKYNKSSNIQANHTESDFNEIHMNVSFNHLKSLVDLGTESPEVEKYIVQSIVKDEKENVEAELFILWYCRDSEVDMIGLIRFS